MFQYEQIGDINLLKDKIEQLELYVTVQNEEIAQLKNQIEENENQYQEEIGENAMIN